MRIRVEQLTSRPNLTVAQYAERHHATPAAIRARIRRGALNAIRPPGGREYLIPNERTCSDVPEAGVPLGVPPGRKVAD